mmetsp:Transcript_8605/g.12656  ORF Transcript_8605/g.12656 Transcript_8605/m.12656 type:complete len:213 (+) Transcript_8605:599-1237(+)
MRAPAARVYKKEIEGSEASPCYSSHQREADGSIIASKGQACPFAEASSSAGTEEGLVPNPDGHSDKPKLAKAAEQNAREAVSWIAQSIGDVDVPAQNPGHACTEGRDGVDQSCGEDADHHKIDGLEVVLMAALDAIEGSGILVIGRRVEKRILDAVLEPGLDDHGSLDYVQDPSEAHRHEAEPILAGESFGKFERHGATINGTRYRGWPAQN